MQSIQAALKKLLRTASPKSTPKDISWTSVDLTSLWEVSSEHLRHIRLLVKYTYPQDREKIEDLLTKIQVNLISQGLDNLLTLRKSLPRILNGVYGQGETRKGSAKPIT